MPKAYIIAQSAISYRRYITRSVKERISLWHLPYGGCHKGGLFLYTFFYTDNRGVKGGEYSQTAEREHISFMRLIR